MTPELEARLAALKFVPAGAEAMEGALEDVRFSAVVHPLKGLALIVTHTHPRTMTQFEVFIPTTASAQTIANAMIYGFLQCHPERRVEFEAAGYQSDWMRELS